MRILVVFLSLAFIGSATAQVRIPHSQKEDTQHIMSDAYWQQWSDSLQSEIDNAIERNRKTDAEIIIKGLPSGSQVHIEQVKHKFFFGAHIFNYNQLGSAEANARYRELYGTLFNSATVGFYWKTFEDRKGRLRFREEYWDTEDYWNHQDKPKYEFHWRRPSTDQIVDYLTERGVRIHGHPLIWGNRKWHHPDWLSDALLSPKEKQTMNRLLVEHANLQNYKDGDVFSEEYRQMSSETLSDSLSHYADGLAEAFRQRIIAIASHYKGKIKSWDVVNESTADYNNGTFLQKGKLCKSVYGIMPNDYVYNAFKTAEQSFPKNVKLNINDYIITDQYTEWTKKLQERNCRIDVIGSQMHLFNPKQCLDLAEGKTGNGLPTPMHVKKCMDILSKAGLPIHLSEITITAPGNDERGRMIQAILTRNLYRLWFSIAAMDGITWWNVLDDCGAPGEPSISGLFFRNMEPKPAYYALDELINNEWKTVMNIKTKEAGKVSFRGFRGHYIISWKDKSGKKHVVETDVE